MKDGFLKKNMTYFQRSLNYNTLESLKKIILLGIDPFICK